MGRVRLDLPERFHYAIELRVRTSDLNYGGHLGNDTVLSLFQEVRLRFFKEHGFSEGYLVKVDGYGILMTDAVIVYKSQAFYADLLTIEIAVANVETYGCDLFYKVTNRETGKEVVRAKTGIVFYDYGAQKIAKVPDKVRGLFAPSSFNPAAAPQGGSL